MSASVRNDINTRSHSRLSSDYCIVPFSHATKLSFPNVIILLAERKWKNLRKFLYFLNARFSFEMPPVLRSAAVASRCLGKLLTTVERQLRRFLTTGNFLWLNGGNVTF